MSRNKDIAADTSEQSENNGNVGLSMEDGNVQAHVEILPPPRTSIERKMVDVSLQGEWEIEMQELHMLTSIGQGSYGTVRYSMWRGTEVAIKVLHDKTIDLNEFFQEISILTRLHHPHVLQVLGCCTLTKPYGIVLEYMPNGSLHYFVSRNNSLSYNQKIVIVKDVARGLAYLHNRKPTAVIHRDLKPSNILLTASWRAKIADFGISSVKPRAEDIYEMTGETGTYRYMAPEVLRYKPYNCKVDMWSMGMLTYAIFVEEPFKQCRSNLHLFQVFEKGNSARTLSYRKLSPDVLKIFMNTTSDNPEHRWDSLFLAQYCNMELNKNNVVKKFGGGCLPMCVR